MAVPKKKTSVSRKGMRHAGQHHKLYLNLAHKCPNCGALANSHCACPACGQYKGMQIFVKRERKSAEQDSNETQTA